MSTRARVGLVAAGIAALAFAWSLALAITGGVEVVLAGHKIASHDPMRLFWIGVVATGVWVWSRGAGRTWQQWQSIAGRVSPRTLALAAAALIVTLGIVHSTKAGTGADSYGYVSETDFWIAGGHPLEQPWVNEVPWPDAEWTFAPLGYRPVEPTTTPPTIVPTYSAGLPWLYGAVKRIAGHCAMFLVVPIAGGVLIFATYGIGRRLGSPVIGAIAACLVATSPIVMYMVPLPMSDVPVAAAWTAAIFFLFGAGFGNAIGAGLATACAIAIRPNLAPCAVALAAWYLIDRRKFSRAIAFGLCAAIGVVAIAWVNHRLYGSMGRSGYGKLNEQIMLANFVPNLRLYLGWLLETQTWAVLAGIAAVVVPLRWFWPDVVDRRPLWILALFTIVLSIEYTGYLVFDVWMYLRFFLPVWPLMMLGLASIAVRLTRLNSPALALTVAGYLAALIVSRYLEGVGRGAWQQWKDAQRDAAIVATVGASIEPNAVVLSMIHSGSMRYYGGRMTLRYDIMKPEWIDRSVAWLQDHGAHPYLLLADWEVTKFRDRFGSSHAVERLSSPLATFPGSSTQLFDLVGDTKPPRVIDAPPRCVEPVQPPIFRLSR